MSTDQRPSSETDRHRSPRKQRVLWIGVALVLVVLLALGLIISALSVRHRLLAAQAEMRRGRSELLAENVSEAEYSFVEARDSFEATKAGAPGLVLRVTGWIPLLGRSPDAVTAIAEAGSEAADAGVVLAHAVAELPGGLASLAPAGGGIPIERLTSLSDAVRRASGEVASALATVERSPDSLLVGPVAEARGQAKEELGSLNDLLRSGSLLLDGLPRFLGQDGPRRYFFGAQNPAELRGTGGVIGAYSILTIRDGRFSFSPFRPIQSLPIPPLDAVPPPSAEYAENYDQFRGGERFWLAINLTPDFPTAAKAILNAYAVVEGTQLDGVIIADPFALEALLRVTGPTVIPGLKSRVDAENVVALTANEAYSLLPDPELRKAVLGSVASGVFNEFLNRAHSSLRDLKILVGAAAEGHILVNSTDPTTEQGLRGTAAGGAFQAPTGDFFSVVENSAGGNKVDFYQDRSVAYTIRLGPDGSAEATTDVKLTNHAPTMGQPRYVIGPCPGFTSEPGESGQLMNVYCGAGCQLESAYRDGTRIALWTGSELGHPFYQDYSRTLSGETSDLRLELQLPQAWQGNGSGGVYRLTFLSQTTIRPTSLLIQVQAPEGMHIVEASPSMQIEGDSAVWTGTPSRRLELEVRFQPSLLMRLWHELF
jgi:hypothetical protein